MKSIRVSIKNWQKYNPRTDRANHSWLRLENTIFFSQDLHGLKLEYKWIWVSLLCLASKAHADGFFEVDLDWLATTAGYDSKVLRSAIQEFMKRPQLGTIEIIETSDAVASGDQLVSSGDRAVSLLHTTNERTNVTKRTYDNEHLAMLDTAYQIYPLKKGKSEGFKKALREIKTKEDAELLIKAVQRYAQEVKDEGLEKKYIKHFSTFMTHWRDYLDPEVGTAINTEKDPFGFLHGDKGASA